MNIRKPLSRLLALSLCCSSALQGIAISAAEQPADPAQTSISETAVSIGNSKISRDFSIADGKIKTDSVLNKKINRTLTPAEGSEDFIISAKYSGDVQTAPSNAAIENRQVYDFANAQAMSREGWAVTLTTVNGTHTVAQADANKLIDGDLDTHPDDYNNAGNPSEVTINFGSVKTINAFSVNKRPGYTDSQYGINGTMGRFELYSSTDGSTWTKFYSGEFTEEDYNLHQEGNLYNVGDTVGRNFNAPVSTQYLKIKQLSNAIGKEGEFTTSEINVYENKLEQVVVTPSQALDRTGWTGTITPKNNGPLSSSAFPTLIDGNLNTFPDEGGSGQGSHAGFPINVDIDMKEEKTISSFSVNKRPGWTTTTDGKNGTMGQYEIYTSEDGTNWTIASQGNIPAEAWNLHDDGNLHNVGDTVYVNLDQETTTRYIRLSVLSNSLGNSDDFTISELNFYSDTYQGPDYRTAPADETVPSERLIRTSDLTYKNAVSEDTEDGKKLTISFEPIQVGEANWTVDEVYVLEDGKDYMRSFLEITTDDTEHSVIDYIDTDAFVIEEDDQDTIWHKPANPRNTHGGLKGYEFLLGQPVYVDGMYMGSEFPAADTTFNEDNDTVQVRYYSGKSFDRLAQDNQLTTDGKFVSWQNVIGSARGTSVEEVKSDFFNYIDGIATPTVFRKQYNSWYDNMKTITDSSIEVSFTQVEENLNANGVDPLDAYVVDDGWIPYNNGNTAESGNTPNKTGFWEINDKFPDDFFRSSAFSSKLQSTFGVWIGPRGGYGSEGYISNIIQAAGTGYKSSAGDICVASRKYARNFTNLAKMFQQEYGVEYWKWDGFVQNVCTNANHDHMVGGPHNMYFTTDLWEAWTDLFEEVRADAASRGKPLFINATCFVHLSPWLLQWVNTVWLQDSGDTGYTGTGEDHEQKIYYRDNVYYNLFNEYQVQFPSKNFYNHDPIYGVSDARGASNATDETWREYLLANAMRGTRFWELYFSPSIVNPEKYEITADVLEWMETNQEVLGKTKMHGGRPASADVYGYSAWLDDEGIVSFTNPKSTETTASLVLDGQAGVVEGMEKLSGIQVEPFVSGTLDQTYGYGDTLTVTLAPHETKIFHFGAKSKGVPAVVSAKNTDNATLAIKFDQRVTPVSATINGKAAETTLHDDYRTIDVPYAVTEAGNVAVELTVKDAFGTEKTMTVDVPVYRSGLIVDTEISGVLGEDADTVYDVQQNDFLLSLNNKAIALNTDNRLEGSSDFTIHTSVKTTSKGADLFNSNDDVKLRINDEGFVEFTVAGRTVCSKEQVTHVTEKATGTFGTDEYVPHQLDTSDIKGGVADGALHTIDASRTPNGMLKIFIDGELRASIHDASLKGLNLAGKNMTLGSAEFAGTVGRLTISNGAAFLDEIEAAAPTDTESAIMIDRSSWTAESCSGANSGGDQGAAGAIDGDLNTRWHSQYDPNDSCADQNHWIKINFNKETAVDTIYYTGRGADINGSFKDYKLELLGKDGEVLLTKEGTLTSSTKEQPIDLGQTVKAYGYKLTQKSAWNGRNFGAAVELNASVKSPLISDETLEAEKAEVLEGVNLDGGHYTTASIDAAKELYKKVSTATNADEVRWDALKAEFEAAKAGLVDTTALDASIAEAAALEENLPANSQTILTAFEDALAAARSAKADGTEASVAAANTDLQNALAALRVDKSLLLLAKDTAEDLEIADFKADSANGFAAALESAASVYETSVSQSEVDNAAKALNAKLLDLRLTPSKTKLDALK